jgi:hypothetical protein
MKQHPPGVYFLCLLHLCIGISAFAGGGSLMLEPNGTFLNMKKALLQHSPFSNYFIPGLILFFLLGIFPLLIIFGLLFKPDWKFFNLFNIYKGRHGAWAYSLFFGIITISWIVLQQAMMTYFFLQPLIAAMGVLIIIVTLMPAVMKYYDVDDR